MTWLRSRLRAGHGGGSKTDVPRAFSSSPCVSRPFVHRALAEGAPTHLFARGVGDARRDCRAGGARVRHHVRPGARRPRRGSGHEERVGPTGRDRARACILEICPRARRGRARVPAPRGEARALARGARVPHGARARPGRVPARRRQAQARRVLGSSAKKFRPAARRLGGAAAELEAKLAAAKAEAEAMKREIAERAASARRRKDAAAKGRRERAAALRRKEAALAKASARKPLAIR